MCGRTAADALNIARNGVTDCGATTTGSAQPEQQAAFAINGIMSRKAIHIIELRDRQ